MDARRRLVVDRTGELGHRIGRHLIGMPVELFASDQDGIHPRMHIGNMRNVDHDHVHADATDDGRTPSADYGIGPVR